MTLALLLWISAARSLAQVLPDFDFTTSAGAAGWSALHDVSKLERTSEGLAINISGPDPYIAGPARNYPAGQSLWMRLRIKTDQAGSAQLFYYQTGASEDKSVRFHVPATGWVDLRVPLPALDARTQLRFDPPGTSGRCVLERMSFELRPRLTEPAWMPPTATPLPPDTLAILSGSLRLRHGAGSLGAFELLVNERKMAVGHNRALVGYIMGAGQRWLVLSNAAEVVKVDAGLTVRTSAEDADGGLWRFEQTFQPDLARPGAIRFESRVTVSQDRQVVYLPMMTLLPGVDSFGTNKTQGLLAGVEYLENEPSSSEADLTGPAARRRVPDPLKITFPLIAIAADSNYVGLIWEQQASVAALHDSPDRVFHAGGHLMGLIFPGADPAGREDGSLLPYDGQLLAAGQPLVARGTIVGGRGNTVVPAVREFVERRGLPALPRTGYDANDYFNLTARGWLDSDIRQGALFRHAVGDNFTANPAADAALYMSWLARKVGDPNLRERLEAQVEQTKARVPAASYNSSGVGHIRMPVEALVFGSVAENVVTMAAEMRSILQQFQADGSIQYHAPATGLDLGRTHWSKEANGLTATTLAGLLERSIFCGQKSLQNEGVRLLRLLSKFRGSVPRGAQTWEVPLHTPDILGSAYLVRAYTIGYELTGDPDFLEQARYWAWTGVPFLYLTPPTDGAAGVYSSIAVFGATQFVAPVWIGLPVQWCGLVYGHAIRLFARHDPDGPWKQLADGIAAAGVQHTHTVSEPKFQGLLPDSFDLRAQNRNPVPINPGTLQPEAVRYFGQGPIHDYRALPHYRLFAHAPGAIKVDQERADGLTLSVEAWPDGDWYLLIVGFGVRPAVKINGVETPIELPHVFQDVDGRLILKLRGRATIDLTTPAKDALRIRKSGADGGALIQWPDKAVEYVLQQSSNLEAPAWRTLGRGVVEGAQPPQLQVATDGAREFFRLNRE